MDICLLNIRVMNTVVGHQKAKELRVNIPMSIQTIPVGFLPLQTAVCTISSTVLINIGAQYHRDTAIYLHRRSTS